MQFRVGGWWGGLVVTLSIVGMGGGSVRGG